MKKAVVVISLGGSLIVPDRVDYKYLEKFRKFVRWIMKSYDVVLVAGGGKTARNYINALHGESNDMKSLVGIMATKLNARLVASSLNLREKIPDSLKEVKDEIKREGIAVCGALGFQPNMTSDGDAAQIARYLQARMLVNLTNVDGLFDKNPLVNKNTKLITKITYKKFLDKINEIRYKPGQHFVLDHTAASIIKDSKIKTYILNGSKIKNLENFFKKKKYVGTLIS